MIEKNKTMHVCDVGILDLMPCLTFQGCIGLGVHRPFLIITITSLVLLLLLLALCSFIPGNEGACFKVPTSNRFTCQGMQERVSTVFLFAIECIVRLLSLISTTAPVHF